MNVLYYSKKQENEKNLKAKGWWGKSWWEIKFLVRVHLVESGPKTASTIGLLTYFVNSITNYWLYATCCDVRKIRRLYSWFRGT